MATLRINLANRIRAGVVHNLYAKGETTGVRKFLFNVSSVAGKCRRSEGPGGIWTLELPSTLEEGKWRTIANIVQSTHEIQVSDSADNLN